MDSVRIASIMLPLYIGYMVLIDHTPSPAQHDPTRQAKTDEDFLASLERCELPPSEFDHAAHLRAGYLYLRATGFAQALERIRSSIRSYAAHLGVADKYHETVTVAYLALIQEHIVARGDGGSWANFRQQNQDLFARDLLLQYYPKEQLDSDLARRTFVLPHRRGTRAP